MLRQLYRRPAEKMSGEKTSFTLEELAMSSWNKRYWSCMVTCCMHIIHELFYFFLTPTSCSCSVKLKERNSASRFSAYQLRSECHCQWPISACFSFGSFLHAQFRRSFMALNFKVFSSFSEVSHSLYLFCWSICFFTINRQDSLTLVRICGCVINYTLMSIAGILSKQNWSMSHSVDLHFLVRKKLFSNFLISRGASVEVLAF